MNSKVLIPLFAVVVTGLLACKKGSADLPPYVGPAAFVNVVNAAADTVNVYQNGTRINTGLSTKNIPFKSATNFAVASAGNNLLTIYPAGSLTPISSTRLNLTAGSAYTVFTKGIPGGTGNNVFSTRLITNR